MLDTAWWSAWALPVGAGVCLAAACGFRTFVPLLCLAIASRTGALSLDAQHAWLASTGALIALASAAIAEVAGYYIPFVDHALDVIATPLAMIAGVLAMFTSIGGDHGVLGWLLAVLLGGGMSGAVQLTTVKARALSTGVTAGFGNPIVATGELASALLLSALAIFVPALAVVVGLVLLMVMWRIVRWIRARATPSSGSFTDR